MNNTGNARNQRKREVADLHEQIKEPFSNRVAVVGAVGAILIAILGLLSYVPGLGLLGSIRGGYIPMAPSTAISFILLGGVLLAMTLRSPSRGSLIVLGAFAGLVSLFGVSEVAENFIGMDLNFENALVPAAGKIGEIPIARMSPFTGAEFFIMGLALIFLLLRARTSGRKILLEHLGGGLGCLTFVIGLIFCIAYFVGSPLLYGHGATIPMALTTALTFMLLGTATIGASGRDAFPMSLPTVIRRAGISMSVQRRFIFLVLIMVTACVAVMGVVTFVLYRHEILEHREMLQATARSQARLIDAVARYDAKMTERLLDEDPLHDASTATLSQIIDAHEHYEGFGETGEFTLARREGNSIVFAMRHRHSNIEHPKPVAYDSALAEPMRLALSGKSGTILGLDYRGETVLAAYEPIPMLKMGIVAKIDMSEIRAPFIRAILIAAIIAVAVILIGTMLFFWISNPVIQRLEEQTQELKSEVAQRRESEGKLLAFMDSATEGFVVYDSNLNLSSINTTGLKIFPPGSTEENLRGKHILEMSPSLKETDRYEQYLNVLKTGQPVSFNDVVPVSVFSDRHLSIHAFKVNDGLGFIFNDITERIQAGEKLRLHNEIFLNMREAVYLVRAKDGVIVYTNLMFEKMFGYLADEMLGKHVSVVNAPTSKKPEDTATDIMKELDEKGIWDGEVNNIKKDGTEFWCSAVVSTFDHPEYGKVILSVHTDITKSKQAQEELQDSEERLRTLVANIPGVSYRCLADEHWTMLFISDEVEVLSGFPASDFVQNRKRSFASIIHPEDAKEAGEIAMNAVERKESYSIEYRIVRADGESRWVFERGQSIFDDRGKPVYLDGVIVDITDRKQAEERLRDSEERNRAWLENSPVCTKIVDLDFNLQYMSRAGAEGLKIDDITQYYGKPYPFAFYPESFRNVMTNNLKKVKRTGEIITQEAPVNDVDGNELWFHSTLVPVNDDEGQIDYIMVVSADITDRKQAEEERERLSHAIEQVGETVMITDIEGLIQYVNPAFERTTGYTRDEAIGQNPRILQNGEHDAAFYKDMWDTLTRGDTWSGELINKKKDGTLFTEEATISPVHNTTGKTTNYIAVKRDITEEIKLKEQFRRAQKMEAVGQLAAGVAHDFNNQLQVIFGYSGLLLSECSEGDPLWEPLTQIRHAAESARSTTSHLLSFSRQQILKPEVVNVVDLLHEIEKPIGRIIRENIKLITAVPPNISPVFLDRSGLHQTIMNLIVNARDAMPNGGKLILKASDITLNKEQAEEYPEAVAGDYVELEVIDNGSGIDQKTLDRLFEPFFTTKEEGKGTGLGLPMVQGFIRQSKGFLRVDSQLGEGTTVRLLLPLTRDKLSLPGADESNPYHIEKAEYEATILVVEDEEKVRSFLAHVLSKAGYRVVTAGLPSEAIDLIQSDGLKPDLVVSDVVMPEMKGDELAEKLKSIDSSLRFLLISGYSDTQSDKYEIMRKPFETTELLERIRDMLKDPQRGDSS